MQTSLPRAASLLAAALTPLWAQAQPPAVTPEVVTIFGQGQTRQVQSLGRAELEQALPGTSPLKSLDKLPGVSFQSADPFGAYEWSTQISVRGFKQNQLGFTLDGIPLGDMTYGPNNGLHIGRAISSDNLLRATLSQGAGELATASTSNLGGTVQFFSQQPADAPGLRWTQTLGSDATARTFLRLDSGLSEHGGKASLSATRQRTSKTKGWGEQNQDQVDAALAQTLGAHQLRAFVNSSERHEVDYADLSLDLLRRFGYDWDNYAPDWQRAVAAARGQYSGGVSTADDAYFLARGIRRDTLAGATLELAPNAAGTLTASLYHHRNVGQGHWYTPFQASPSGLPLSIRTTEYQLRRNGLILDWSLALGAHTVSAGLWRERSSHQVSRNFYSVDGPQDSDRLLSGPFRTAFSQDFLSTTHQWYLADSVLLADGRLKLNGGVKSPHSRIVGVNRVPGRAEGTLTAARNFLPQAGANYRFNQRDEVFLSLARNMRAYQPGTAGPFSTTQAAFDAGAAALRPETSTNIEAGYRLRGPALQGSVSLYHADFRDRLLNVASCSGIAGCPSTFVNVGKVRSRGMEAAAVWKAAPGWSWFNAVTWNDARYQSDYLDAASPVRDANGNGVVRAAGKQVVDNARVLLSSELAFEHGRWFGRAGAKYTGKRYYTYLNDIEVPAYRVASLSAGYRLPAMGWLKSATLQLNVENLFDRRYLSTAGTNGYVNSDPHGDFATLMSGAPRQLFISFSGKL
ncbi:TonB-dependent receptor [Oxalobacteraceae bacterium]|nr:TonB-dependent receptor [Oxalobacteraceae bacterium]